MICDLKEVTVHAAARRRSLGFPPLPQRWLADGRLAAGRRAHRLTVRGLFGLQRFIHLKSVYLVSTRDAADYEELEDELQ